MEGKQKLKDGWKEIYVNWIVKVNILFKMY